MENYFSSNENVLATFGINFGAVKSKIAKFEVPLKIFTVTVLLSSTLQSFMFCVTNDTFDLFSAVAITVGLYDIQGCFKYLTVLWNEKKLKEIKEKLRKLVNLITEDQVAANISELKRYRKLTSAIFITYTSCIAFCNVMPLIYLCYFYAVDGTVVMLMPCAFWYPFDKFKYFAPTYVYEMFSGHILTVVPPAMDGLMLLMVGQFIVLFKCLGEDFATIINDFDASKRAGTVEKLKMKIFFHNYLLDLSAEFFEIFEIPLLVNVMAQSAYICFITFIVSVNTFSYFFLMKFEAFSLFHI